jgi:CheY-like chemotaxis protein
MQDDSTETTNKRFGIQQVAELVGVQTHVLRYWETEFPMLGPKKRLVGKREYSERDVQIAKRLKELLYEEQYTIAGAKKKLAGELDAAEQMRQDLSAKILLADNDSEMRDLLAEYLRRLNFEVFTADTLERAIEVTSKSPDLGVVDLAQSKDEQVRVIQFLVSRNIPVIVLSAHDHFDDKMDAFEAGASDFVSKPFSPRELDYRIKALLRRKPNPELTPTLTASPPAAKRVRDPYRLLGEVLNDRYELVEYAGGGGMGAVYKALDHETNARAAVKILKPDVAQRNPEYNDLFEKEVRAAQKLSHPNIVSVLDSGIQDDVAFMVMEWVDGKSLEDVIANERISIDRVEMIFAQICDAIAHAHSRGVIHLDIKPANIFLVDQQGRLDFVKIFDFGLARIITKESGTTVTRFRGTYQYCAPEQFGGKVSYRSDIYSLAATLYHLICGVIPFSSTYINAKIHPNLELPAVPSVTKYRSLHTEIDSVLAKGLSKEPASRYDSVAELFEEFSKIVDLKAHRKERLNIPQ